MAELKTGVTNQSVTGYLKDIELSDIHEKVLSELIKSSLDDMKKKYV